MLALAVSRLKSSRGTHQLAQPVGEAGARGSRARGQAAAAAARARTFTRMNELAVDGDQDMDKAQAAREAKALTAEWLWMVRRTDDERWRECYAPADAARVAAELDRIERRFEQYGPSLFHRQAADRRGISRGERGT